MPAFNLEARLHEEKATWLVTGAAGFIGSHLMQRLLNEGQNVIGLDNFSTGYRKNLDAVLKAVGPDAAARFAFIEGDIADLTVCNQACATGPVKYVLHQAALGSVPRSIVDPLASHRSNVNGFLNMLVAARDAKISRFVYASSSSVYGDHPVLPKVEEQVGRVLSPYAATKHINEVYAGVFERIYGLQTAGLRYFNVFGPRQDPDGAYAAVIPKWLAALARGEAVQLNGDGKTSRDFCFVANAVQANLRSALAQGSNVSDTVYNVAVGDRTSLMQLHDMIRERVISTLKKPELSALTPTYQPERAGDIRDSQADISKASERLGYAPTHTVAQGLDETVAPFLKALL